MPALLDDGEVLDGRSLTAIAFDRVRADLIRGVLRPGERLRVQAVSSRYGTGPTAVREALSRLASEGLVEFEDQRGFRVAPVSRVDLVDLTETRVDIECLALARAIERGDTAWEAEILASYHRLSKSPPPISPEAAAVWGGAHQHFHETLIAGCGSTWLRTLCRLLYDRSERYRYLSNLRAPSQAAPREDEHRLVMDAVLGRDATAAGRLLASHYRKTTAIILDAPEAVSLFEPGKSTRKGARLTT